MPVRALRPLAGGLVLAVSLVATDAALAQGCAMCGTVGQGAGDPLVRGMYSSLLFMVSMPFAVVAAVGGWFAYRLRRGEPRPPGDGGEPDAERRVIPFRRD